LAGCRVNSEASPQFNKLREHWKRSYPHIDDDLALAFSSISQDILACSAFRLKAGALVEVYKYRQNSKDIRRGAKYGWRVLALYHKPSNVVYPILVYPKTVWEDANNAVVDEAVKEMRQLLGYCIKSGCDGTMTATPSESKGPEGPTHTKTRCDKCGCVQWVDV